MCAYVAVRFVYIVNANLTSGPHHPIHVVPVSKVVPTRNVQAPTSRPAATGPKTGSRTQLETNGSSGAAATNHHQIEELSTQLLDMKVNVEGLEKERDFYFSKLRDIEIMCQEVEGSDTLPLVQKILDVLYQTEVGVLLCLL